MKKRHIKFSRSDLILPPAEWLHRVISKINENIDCDSLNDQYRRYSEKVLIQEIEYAEHLIQHGYVMIKLKSSKCVNLARIASRNIKGLLLVELPMVNPKSHKLIYRSDKSVADLETLTENDHTWNWWNYFRSHTDFNQKVKLALELSEDIPSEEELARWLGEPVECLIIPSQLFIINQKNYPVLKRVSFLGPASSADLSLNAIFFRSIKTLLGHSFVNIVHLL
jgi:type II protein arginine methyltransferase